MVEDPHVDNGNAEDGDELCMSVLDDAVAPVVVEAVAVGLVNIAKRAAVHGYDVGHGPAILVTHDLRPLEVVGEHVEWLLVDVGVHEHLPLAQQPGKCALLWLGED